MAEPTSPSEDVYEAAARAYDAAGGWVDPVAAIRACVDSAYAAGVAAGRAQAAADIRGLRDPGWVAFPADLCQSPYWSRLSGPYGAGYIEWAARIAGGEPRG